jgi:hypothetical protein
VAARRHRSTSPPVRCRPIRGPASARPHRDQRALALDELADLDAVYGYSFIVTNLDTSTLDRVAAAEHQ